MTVPAFRCANEAELRGDAMPGTAWPHSRVLLVHQPGPWGPRGLTESRCEPDVARRIDVAAAAAGMRLQAIRRSGKHEIGKPAGGYAIGIADVGAGAISWRHADDLSDVASWLEQGSEMPAPATVDADPLYLVCTHGRHDACCALRGRPLAQALQHARPGRVWETTHLGGDRFAANLLVLPSGEMYGRVQPSAAAELADRADADEVVPDLMRGRIGLAPIAQAALIYAHRQLGILDRRALAIASEQRIDAARSQVTLNTPRGPVVVTVAIETGAPAQLTCRGTQAARARTYRATAIEPIPDASAMR